MKFLAFIFFACALQSIYANVIKEAIQEGNNKIAQLKFFWQKQIPTIEKIILPKIDAFEEEFYEAVADVNTQVKNDTAKLKAVEIVKVAYGTFIVESRKTAYKIIYNRPNVLERGFRGVGNRSYMRLNNAGELIRYFAKGNHRNEALSIEYDKYLLQRVNQVTECFLKGGSNFPVPPNYLLTLEDNVRNVTNDSINSYNRCTEKVGTICFYNLFKQLNKEVQNATKFGDSYESLPRSEIDTQRNVSIYCAWDVTSQFTNDLQTFLTKWQ